MSYFALNIDLYRRKVVIIGGGKIATRKCLAIVDVGAIVTVVTPRLSPPIQELAANGIVTHVDREYCYGDIAGNFLAFAATDNRNVNVLVAREAQELGVPVNVADDPALCSFTLPASVSRGDLLLTVSTSGKCPALAGRIRGEIEQHYGKEYEAALLLLGKVREKLLTQNSGSAYNKEILNRFIDHDLPTLVKDRRFLEINHLLQKLFGPGFTLAALGLGEKDLT